MTKQKNKYLINYFPNAIRQETPLGRAYKDPTDESENPFLAISVTTILGLVLSKGAHFDKWLKTNGNPFTKIGLDDDGISSIEWGVYGLPETFLIDKKGSIIYRHVGPIMSKDLEKFRNILK